MLLPCLAIVALIAGQSPAQATGRTAVQTPSGTLTPMTGPDVARTFSGTIENGRYSYQPDGSVVQPLLGQGPGLWTIEGDALCISFAAVAWSECRTYARDERGDVFRIGLGSASHTLRATEPTYVHINRAR